MYRERIPTVAKGERVSFYCMHLLCCTKYTSTEVDRLFYALFFPFFYRLRNTPLGEHPGALKDDTDVKWTGLRCVCVDLSTSGTT